MYVWIYFILSVFYVLEIYAFKYFYLNLEVYDVMKEWLILYIYINFLAITVELRYSIK